ncbi:hypothetical protein GCM10007938_37050 [Vibrio zhanjiangensis]|uniref:DUF3289 family protein n=1 Tax=Vibrio zhanjiangensis TaxID=1046128 RepID=A0ABQ6F3T6_9VIBR|nr:DUF3289 family protein [Vibrio zhanjiangensis]GLT19922.1 hypothetical protein GCM10007938_37050 [Vibrio zhanjiangensis]
MRYESFPYAPEERQETTRERAERQRQERRAELTYTAKDQKRWAENRERVLAERKLAEEWKPVGGNFPLLVYQTQNKMDDFDAPDMTFGDEDRFKIESYGLMQPFSQSVNYDPDNIASDGSHTSLSEDQFSLPASEHFERMRSLGKVFSNVTVGSILGFETSSVFSEMVDKFERNEGGYYNNPLLDKALKEHETTARFHQALKKCLEESLQNGKLPDNIVDISSRYLGKGGKRPSNLPHFPISKKSLFDGTVLTIHGIWSMRVYVENLEYKGNQIRGTFKYEIQDHFGLDVRDIDHNSFDGIKENDGKPYEWLEGFRSWYLLQHFKEYGYQPFITKMDFSL